MTSSLVPSVSPTNANGISYGILSTTAVPSRTGDIAYDILPSVTPWPLQSAVTSYEESRGLALMQPYPPESLGYHMHQACTDVTQVFASAQNFQDCLAYPLVSLAGSSEGLNVSADPFLNYGIFPPVNVQFKRIVGTITTCLEGYARSLPECLEPASDDCPLSSCSFFPITNLTLQWPVSIYSDSAETPFSASSCVKAFCDYVTKTATVNTDIAGIGVEP